MLPLEAELKILIPFWGFGGFETDFYNILIIL